MCHDTNVQMIRPKSLGSGGGGGQRTGKCTPSRIYFVEEILENVWRAERGKRKVAFLCFLLGWKESMIESFFLLIHTSTGTKQACYIVVTDKCQLVVSSR